MQNFVHLAGVFSYGILEVYYSKTPIDNEPFDFITQNQYIVFVCHSITVNLSVDIIKITGYSVFPDNIFV
jgi:hypothetical protein